MAKIATKRPDATGVTFTFAHGRTLRCDIGALSDDMIRHAAVMGINHAVGDAYADNSGPADAYAKAAAKWDAIVAGTWSVRAPTSLSEALARATNRPLDECVAAVARLDESQKRLLRKSPAIAKALAEIELERIGDVDGGDDLTSLFA